MRPEERFMQEAVSEAKKGAAKGEVPVGAVIIKDGVVISRAHSLARAKSDPTAHAEILAIRKAAAKLKVDRLTGCDLYATIEPCAMCAGAIVLARLDRIFYGAAEPKTGAAGSVFDVLREPRLNHRVEVKGGLLADECATVVREFFSGKRGK